MAAEYGGHVGRPGAPPGFGIARTRTRRQQRKQYKQRVEAELHILSVQLLEMTGQIVSNKDVATNGEQATQVIEGNVEDKAQQEDMAAEDEGADIQDFAGLENDGHDAAEEELDSSESYSTVDTEDFKYASQRIDTVRYFEELIASFDSDGFIAQFSAMLDKCPDDIHSEVAFDSDQKHEFIDQFLDGVDSHFEGLDTFDIQPQVNKDTAPHAEIPDNQVVDGFFEALLTAKYGELTAEAIHHKLGTLGARISKQKVLWALERWIEVGAVRKSGDMFVLRID